MGSTKILLVVFFYSSFLASLASSSLYQAATVKSKRNSFTHHVIPQVDNRHECAAFCELRHQSGDRCNSFYIKANLSGTFTGEVIFLDQNSYGIESLECHLQYLDESSIDMVLPFSNSSGAKVLVDIKKSEIYGKMKSILMYFLLGKSVNSVTNMTECGRGTQMFPAYLSNACCLAF